MWVTVLVQTATNTCFLTVRDMILFMLEI